MSFRPLVLFLALAGGPVAAQDAMRLDLNATAPVPQASAEAPAAKPAQAAKPATTPPAPTARPAGIGVAQNTAVVGGADDKDHIIGCSIIYQRIADMYRERGETEKADTFLSTAYAYSQASDILYTRELGAENAYESMSQRMSVVSEALNREAQGYSNGDLGVINAWLGWCDERGTFVQNTMNEFQAEQAKDQPAQ